MKKNNSILLSTPYILWMVVFTLIPLGVVCYYALTDPATGEFTLNNLKDLNAYWGVLWQSIAYSLVSAFICLLLGYPVAYFIAHCKETTQKILYMLVILPLSVPGILSGITMVFVPAVSTFYISQKLGGTGTVLIGDVIERQFKQGNNPNLGAALSLVLMILVFVCTGIMNRFGSDEEGGVIV